MKKDYKPQPIDVSNIELPEDLQSLAEKIAENVHDVWAKKRMNEGWTYGPHRDDVMKTTPCMVSYDDLPDSEKAYDRDTAVSTIKLIKALGFDIQRSKKE